MTDTPKRVDLRVGQFACSIQGFKNPAKPLGDILVALRAAVSDQGDVPGAGVALDAETLDRLAREIADGQGLDAGEVEILPGLIAVRRLPADVHETAVEDADIAEAAALAAAVTTTEDEEPTAAPDDGGEGQSEPNGDPEEVEQLAEPWNQRQATDGEREKIVAFPPSQGMADDTGPAHEEPSTTGAEAAARQSDDPYIRELAERIERINADAGRAAREGHDVSEFTALQEHAESASQDAETEGLATGVAMQAAGAGGSIFAAPGGTEQAVPDVEAGGPDAGPALEGAADVTGPESAGASIFADPEPDGDSPLEAPQTEETKPAVAELEAGPDEDAAAGLDGAPSTIFADPDAAEDAPSQDERSDDEQADDLPRAEPANENIFAVPSGDGGAEEAGAGELRARFDSLIERYQQMDYDIEPDEAAPTGAMPEDDTLSADDKSLEADAAAQGDGPDGEAEVGEVDPALADLVQRSGAESTAEVLACAAAWLELIQGREKFSRPEVIAVFDRIEGSHDRSPEARILAFSALLRNGSIVKTGDGAFVLGPDLRNTLESVIP